MLNSDHVRLLGYAVQGFVGVRDGVLLVLRSVHDSDHKVEATQVEAEKTEKTEKFVIKAWRSLR